MSRPAVLGWLALRLIRQRQHAEASSTEEPALISWKEAACPDCLAIMAVRQLTGSVIDPADA
jgi:hypothetical protein